MANAGHVSQSAKTPAEFLKSIKGKPVVVKLNSGVDYRGEALHCNLLDVDSIVKDHIVECNKKGSLAQESWLAWMGT